MALPKIRRAFAIVAFLVLPGACGSSSELELAARDSGAAGDDARSDVGDAPPPPAPLAPLQVRLDTSFGTPGSPAGSVEGDLSAWEPDGVGIDAQGRIVVSGPGNPPGSSPTEIVQRFAADGTVDATFGASGLVAFTLSPDQERQTVRVLPDGRIGILGAIALDGDEGAFGARLTAAGLSDPALVAEPIVVTSGGAFSSGIWRDDGSGYVFGTDGVVRFDATGAIDAAYGSRGQIAPATAGAVAAADGRLWTVSGNRVARYLASGAPDATFGAAGSVDLLFGDAGVAPVLATLQLESSGDAIVVGSTAGFGFYDVLVARLTATGKTDPGYGGDGFVSVQADGAAVGAARLADGRVLVWTCCGELFTIAPDGTTQESSELGVLGTVLGATLDTSQRLVVVGQATDDPASLTWFVRRYLLF